MKEQIEQLLAEVRNLTCKTEKDIEDARVRLLGKKGEIKIGRASCRERV